MVFDDPQFKKEEIAFMDQVERFNYSIKQELVAIKKIRELGWNAVDNREEVQWLRRYFSSRNHFNFLSNKLVRPFELYCSLA